MAWALCPRYLVLYSRKLPRPGRYLSKVDVCAASVGLGKKWVLPLQPRVQILDGQMDHHFMVMSGVQTGHLMRLLKAENMGFSQD